MENQGTFGACRQYGFSTLWSGYATGDDAKKARDVFSRTLRKLGFRVRGFSLRNSVRDYAGSGRPNGRSCRVYMANVYAETDGALATPDMLHRRMEAHPTLRMAKQLCDETLDLRGLYENVGYAHGATRDLEGRHRHLRGSVLQVLLELVAQTKHDDEVLKESRERGSPEAAVEPDITGDGVLITREAGGQYRVRVVREGKVDVDESYDNWAQVNGVVMDITSRSDFAPEGTYS